MPIPSRRKGDAMFWGELQMFMNLIQTVTLKSLQRTKLQHPHQINLHPDLHTSDLVKTD